MRVARSVVSCFALFLTAALCVSSAIAQTSETGLPPFGSFQGGKFDLVSLENGNLHIEMPIYSVHQRAFPDKTYNFVYDIPGWEIDKSPTSPTTFQWVVAPAPHQLSGWHLLANLVGPWHVDHDIVAKTCTYVVDGFTYTQNYNVHTNYVLTDTHGTTHPFEVRHVDQPGSGCADPVGNQNTGVALDGSGIMIAIGSNGYSTTISMPNDYGPLNGNSFATSGISETDQNDGNGNLVATIWTYSDSNGVSQQIRMDYAPVSFLTHFCTILNVGSSPCTEYGATSQLPQKLTLPTGKFYFFTWSTDGNGDLLRLDLPTGGYIAYTYQTFTKYLGITYSGGTDGIGRGSGTPSTHYLGRRQVTSRSVSDGSVINTWTYNGGTVHDPLGNDQVHAFTALSDGVNPPRYETQIRYYQGSATSGSLLRTVDKDYASEVSTQQSDAIDHGAINVRLIRETTILEDGSTQWKVETDFETFQQVADPMFGFTVTRLNPIEKREYAYGAGAPGALLRRTDYAYLHANNQNYLSRNIVRQVATTTVYAGNNNQVAQTVNEYDNYSHPGQPMVVSNAIQHDAAYNTSFVYRGNVTATSHWRNTDGAMLTSTYQYDDAGNVLSAIDPLGHKTSYDFTDSWGNTSCVPSGQAKLTPTTITNALNQSFRKMYNSCTATLASSTDLNSKTATYSYDSMNRLTTLTSPDGGRTVNTFDDSQLMVTSNTLVTSGAAIFKRRHYDQLGRVKQAEVCEDGTSACATSIKIDTGFDGLDQTVSVSNPYRTSSDPGPTNGITTTQYDGVGRAIKVIPPDGSVSANNFSTAYTANCMTVTDPAGKIRKSCGDALGRVIEVDEPGGGGPAASGSGSATTSGSEQSIGGPSATSGSGSASVSGNEQSIPGSAATPGTGSVTISGSERTTAGGGCTQRTCTIYDIGGVQITVNGFSKVVNYGKGSFANTIASALASAFNTDTNSPITASVSSSTVTLTSKVSGSASNYSLSATSWTNDPTDFSGPSFTATRSGSTLTGGQNAGPTTYDSGSVWVTVNGFQALANYGQGSSSSTLASAIANTLNTNGSSPVTASVSGSTVALTARAAGSSTNYSLSVGSSTSQPGSFASPSFSVSVSGANLTGGNDAGPTIYDSGSAWVTVNGFQALANYGQGSTSSTVAAAIASVLNTNSSSPVTASVSGSAVTLTARATGAATNYSLSSGSSTSQPNSFASASFSVSISGVALTGGADANPGSLVTPAVTLYTYDTLDNLTCVVQKSFDTSTFSTCGAAPSAWRPRSFTYNSLSQLLTENNPESGAVSYGYDNDGNLLTKTGAAPNQVGSATVTMTYTYDALHRSTQMSFSDNTPTVKYGYDGIPPAGCALPVLTINNGIGKRTGMCDAAGAEAWSYDLIVNTGWKFTDVRTTNGVTKPIIVQNNLAGSPATLAYPSGRVITYSYDLAGRATSTVDSTGPITYATGALYAPQGVPSSLTHGSGIVSTYVFNNRLQPCWMYTTTGTPLPPDTTQCSGTAAAGNILDLKYNFGLGVGDNGNVTAITNGRDNTRSQNFAYDVLNRLATMQTQTAGVSIPNSNCWGLTFGYDAWANLLQSGTTGPAGCGEPLPLNVTVTPANRISGYCYDTPGNLLDPGGCPAGSNPHAYVYNAENQLTSVGGVTYVYDGDGKRVQKSSGKLYRYGFGGDALDETDLVGNTNNSSFFEYIFFRGKRIARRDYLNTVFYYFADHLGTARVSTDSSGSICYDADFYPFGGERIVTDTCDSAYKFTGKERDSESGLDNFGARYDSSSLGRFMSPDSTAYVKPINPQSWNLYAYARNNPLLYVDPTGNTVSLANCQDKNKCVQVLTNAGALLAKPN